MTNQITQCSHQLKNFKLISRNDFTVPIVYSWLDYTWETEGKTILLRQLFVECKPVNLIMTLTTTPEDVAGHESAWREVIKSFKLRSAEELSSDKLAG